MGEGGVLNEGLVEGCGRPCAGAASPANASARAREHKRSRPPRMRDSPRTHPNAARSVKSGGAFKKSEWGGDFCPSMAPQDGDIVIEGKRGLCGFASTNLDFILKQRRVETVALAGFLVRRLAAGVFLFAAAVHAVRAVVRAARSACPVSTSWRPNPPLIGTPSPTLYTHTNRPTAASSRRCAPPTRRATTSSR